MLNRINQEAEIKNDSVNICIWLTLINPFSEGGE